MKRIILIITMNFILLFLISCFNIDHKIDIKSSGHNFDETADLYIPIPVKNNSVFIGYTILNDSDDRVIQELDYKILQERAKNCKLDLVANYLNLSDEELFNIVEQKNNYAIEVNDLGAYPREITIPMEYENKRISEINKYGFNGIENLVIINLSGNIEYIQEYAFAHTSLYKITNQGTADFTAFSNSLVDGLNKQDFDFELIEDTYQKQTTFNKINYEINIDLNGGKIIKKELELVVSRPIIENQIFESLRNEEGKEIVFEEGKMYASISLREYYRNMVGFTYIIKSRELSEKNYIFKYLKASDSYAISLSEENLPLSKVVLPDTYLDKKITKIENFNNQYLNELILGKYVNRIEGKLNLPNLKKIQTANTTLIKIDQDTFTNTLINPSQFGHYIKQQPN